ncbi:MAG: S8 family serine peptidase [Nanoarchaeota archaeon]
MLIKPDVVAPGVDICAAYAHGISIWDDKKCLDDNHIAISGTSMATPHVAGAVALLLQKHPDWTPEEIKMALKNTAVDLGFGIKEQGAGKVDILNAVKSGKPLISIINPTDLGKGIIKITGTASGANFKNYEIYFGKTEKPTSYNLIATSTSQINNDILATWDTSSLDSGIYLIKLIVSSNDNYQYVDYGYVDVENDLMTGFPSAIHYPWGEIASWSGFTPTVADINNDVFKEILFQKWGPIYFDYKGGEKILGNSQIFLDTVSNFPLAPPAIADINKDGKQELIFAGTDLNSINGNTRCFNIFDASGNSLPGWPQTCPDFDGTIDDHQQESGIQITLSDLKGDGYQEIISPFKGFNLNSDIIKKIGVVVYNQDGTILKGWPQYIPINSYSVIDIPSVAIGDLNGDGKKEIVAFVQKAKQCCIKNDVEEIYAWNIDGSLVSGFPIELPTSLNPINYLNPPSIILTDIDKDGKLEIGFPTNMIYPGQITFIHIDGSVVKGFPFNIPFNSHFYGSYNPQLPVDNGDIQFSSMVASDLNKEGYPEIIFGTSGDMWSGDSKVYILNYNGIVMQGWPQKVSGAIFVQPTVGDIDGDGKLDITTTTFNGYVYAWKSSGELINGYPKKMYAPSQSGTVISDIDNDGKNELIAVSENGLVYVWKTNGIADSTSKEWGMYRGDAQHTGAYTPSSCVFKTCLELGKTCGDWGDGCGGTVDCGICDSSCHPNGDFIFGLSSNCCSEKSDWLGVCSDCQDNGEWSGIANQDSCCSGKTDLFGICSPCYSSGTTINFPYLDNGRCCNSWDWVTRLDANFCCYNEPTDVTEDANFCCWANSWNDFGCWWNADNCGTHSNQHYKWGCWWNAEYCGTSAVNDHQVCT